jgi:hypothetical protein
MKKKPTQPAEQAGRLEFWMRLANAVPPEKDEKIWSAGKAEEITRQPWPKLSSSMEQEFLWRFEAEGRPPFRRNLSARLRKTLPRLAQSVALVLRTFAHGTTEYQFEHFGDISVGAAWKDRSGKIDGYFINPIGLFLDDLRETEVERIRECPVCKHLFFAKREDQPCCKPSCANVRRVYMARERKLERISGQKKGLGGRGKHSHHQNK